MSRKRPSPPTPASPHLPEARTTQAQSGERLALHLLLGLLFALPVVFSLRTLEAFELVKTQLALAVSILILACLGWDRTPPAEPSTASSSKRPWPVNPLVLALGGWGVSAVLSTVTATSPSTALLGDHESYEGLLTFGAYGLLFVAARTLATRRSTASTLAWGMLRVPVLSTLVVVGYACVQVLGYDPIAWKRGSDFLGYVRLASTLGNPNLMAGYLVVTLPLVVLEARRRYRQGAPYLATGLAVLAVLDALLVVLSLSRAAWLAALAALATALALHAQTSKVGAEVVATQEEQEEKVNSPRPTQETTRHRMMQPAGLALILALLGFGLSVGLHKPLREALTHRLHNVTEAKARLEIARISVHMANQHPWLGTGLDGYAWAFAHHRTIAYQLAEWGKTPTKAHIWPLHVLVTQGVVGLFAWLTLIGATVVSARRIWHCAIKRRDVEHLDTVTALVCSLVGYVVSTSLTFSVAAPTVFFVTLLGALSVWSDAAQDLTDTEPQPLATARLYTTEALPPALSNRTALDAAPPKTPVVSSNPQWLALSGLEPDGLDFATSTFVGLSVFLAFACFFDGAAQLPAPAQGQGLLMLILVCILSVTLGMATLSPSSESPLTSTSRSGGNVEGTHLKAASRKAARREADASGGLYPRRWAIAIFTFWMLGIPLVLAGSEAPPWFGGVSARFWMADMSCRSCLQAAPSDARRALQLAYAATRLNPYRPIYWGDVLDLETTLGSTSGEQAPAHQQAALKAAKEAVACLPDNGFALCQLGNLQAHLAQLSVQGTTTRTNSLMNESLQSYDHALALDPHNVEFAWAAARVALHTHDQARARSYAVRVATDYPGMGAALLGSGRYLCLSGSTEAGWQLLAQAQTASWAQPGPQPEGIEGDLQGNACLWEAAAALHLVDELLTQVDTGDLVKASDKKPVKATVRTTKSSATQASAAQASARQSIEAQSTALANLALARSREAQMRLRKSALEAPDWARYYEGVALLRLGLSKDGHTVLTTLKTRSVWPKLRILAEQAIRIKALANRHHADKDLGRRTQVKPYPLRGKTSVPPEVSLPLPWPEVTLPATPASL